MVKKFFIVLCLILIPSLGMTQSVTHYFQSTAGITMASTGATVDMSVNPMKNFTIIVDRTAGADDVVDIQLQCSIDGTIFVPLLGILSLAGEPVINTPADPAQPCRFMRYEVLVPGVGNTLTIQLLASK